MNVTESAVRYWARRAGLSLKKSRSRTPESPSFGGYMLVEPYRNIVVAGAWPNAFSLDLEEAFELVEEALSETE